MASLERPQRDAAPGGRRLGAGVEHALRRLDVANFFVASFRGLFTPKDVDLRVVVNWGIAAVVYFAIASLIARLLAR